jgi:hypothetical protein
MKYSSRSRPVTPLRAATSATPAMDGSSGTPPTPPYSVPPPPTAGTGAIPPTTAPNPSGGAGNAAAGSAGTRALFIPSRTSTGAALPPIAPQKGKSTATKRGAAAAAPKPKAPRNSAATRRAQAAPVPQSHPPLLYLHRLLDGRRQPRPLSPRATCLMKLKQGKNSLFLLFFRYICMFF